MNEVDLRVIATTAAIITGFGSAAFIFRLRRELEMERSGEPIWLPWADRLLLSAILISVFFVLLPIFVLEPGAGLIRAIRALLAASLVLMGGYFPAVLAHYRMILGGARTRPRRQTETWEVRICWMAVCLALAAGAASIVWGHS